MAQTGGVDVEADWRPVVAALANGDARAVWAQLVVDGREPDGMGPARARRARELLRRAGLVRSAGDGWAVDDGALRRLLAADASARPKRQGVDRFLRPDGRIDRYPSSEGDRRALLEHVAASVLQPGEVIGERELTERLAARSDDPVALRRHLVDAGLVGRTRSGSEYALTR